MLQCCCNAAKSQPWLEDASGAWKLSSTNCEAWRKLCCYSGCFLPNPSYQEVCTGANNHAEAVQITFDPQIISFKELLEVFLTIHDPTTLNRQGADVGTQYRSAIFYHTSEQAKIAKVVIAELESEKIWDAPIITEITPFKAFYSAEKYHQAYFLHNPDQPYCRVVIEPKVAKFRKQFLAKLRK